MKNREIDFIAEMLSLAMETQDSSKKNNLLDYVTISLCSGVEDSASYSKQRWISWEKEQRSFLKK